MKPEIKKEYYLNGNLKKIEYLLNYLLHKENGPAYIYYFENGNIDSEKYLLNGKLHREDGPAYIDYFSNGKIFFQRYYINGKGLSESEWLIHSRKRKLKNL